MTTEGVVKFSCHWNRRPPEPGWPPQELNRWRSRLHALGLVGVYPNRIGYGNVSQRAEYPGQFVISGTQTGAWEQLGPEHYTRVVSVDLAGNAVTCEGPIRASSESLTHAVIYQSIPAVQCVFHVHHAALWTRLLHHLPTTSEAAAYGTPELARELLRLGRELAGQACGLVVMGGHPEGLLAFAEQPEQAGSLLLKYLAE
ncbi:MAG: class II aldolase/adducin family protein [candidate division FCPU426 bacterium]